MKNYFLSILFFTSLILMSFVPNKYVTVLLVTDSNDDVKTVTTIRTTLMTAEKVAKLLNVELIADDVATDVFVFNINSAEQKDLTMTIFDEEGYELVGQRELTIDGGNNYRGLNVRSLEDGTYIFKLSDKNGNEISKKIEVQKQ